MKKTAREILEELAYMGEGDHSYMCEAVDQALSDLSELVMGEKKDVVGLGHESVRDNNGKHLGTLKYPVTYPLNESYNQAVTDIAKLILSKKEEPNETL